MLQRLLNFIETLSTKQDRLKAENQQLRNEISQRHFRLRVTLPAHF